MVLRESQMFLAQTLSSFQRAELELWVSRAKSSLPEERALGAIEMMAMHIQRSSILLTSAQIWHRDASERTGDPELT